MSRFPQRTAFPGFSTSNSSEDTEIDSKRVLRNTNQKTCCCVTYLNSEWCSSLWKRNIRIAHFIVGLMLTLVNVCKFEKILRVHQTNGWFSTEKEFILVLIVGFFVNILMGIFVPAILLALWVPFQACNLVYFTFFF